VSRRKISPRKIINMTRWAKGRTKVGNSTRHFDSSLVFGMKGLKTNNQAVRQHF
jgi:hypothetical protein